MSRPAASAAGGAPPPSRPGPAEADADAPVAEQIEGVQHAVTAAFGWVQDAGRAFAAHGGRFPTLPAEHRAVAGGLAAVTRDLPGRARPPGRGGRAGAAARGRGRGDPPSVGGELSLLAGGAAAGGVVSRAR